MMKNKKIYQKLLKWIKQNINSNVYVSIMAQYFPTYKAKEDDLINRKLTKREYKQIEEYFYFLDFTILNQSLIHSSFHDHRGKHMLCRFRLSSHLAYICLYRSLVRR